MKNLYQFILEGGAAGHMAHPYDCDQFTLRNLKGLIRNLLSGKIEDITEKIDGTNIQATVNPAGETVFIRNKTDLNSARGGMTLSDMAAKWVNNPSVAHTFTTAGAIIEKVLTQLPNKFFNPDESTKVIVNCECVVAGKTNIMPYMEDQVDFHNLWIYKFNGTEWVKDEVTKDGIDKIDKACKKIQGAQVTPQVIIDTTKTSNELIVKYIKQLDKIFKDAKMKEQDTIGDYKRARLYEYLDEHYPWLSEYKDKLFERWFEGNKSFNLRQLKTALPDHTEAIDELDKKGYKEIVSKCCEPINNFFAEFGNDVIELCNNIINDKVRDDVVMTLRSDLKDIVKDIQSGGSEELNNKLSIQLNKLEKLGNKINPTEGIVFKVGDQIMKLTGSFGALNQILGSIKFSR